MTCRGSGLPGLRSGAVLPANSAGLKYRVPLAPSLDGNTVDPQLEQAAFAEADHVIELELINQRLIATSMEPRAAAAHLLPQE